MSILPGRKTLDGRFSAYCGICWDAVFSLWVGVDQPDYTRCPLGDYSAQTCPNSVGKARLVGFLAGIPKTAKGGD